MRRQRRSITDIICENCKYLPTKRSRNKRKPIPKESDVKTFNYTAHLWDKDDCSREFSQRNFASAYYIDEQTKEFLAELEKNHESVVFTERGAQASFFCITAVLRNNPSQKVGK